MKLQIGERLAGSGLKDQPGGYVATDLVGETPWHQVYAGKKKLYSFDFTGKRLREAGEAEWLDVWLRTLSYPCLDDEHYLARRRALARAEVGMIAGSGANLWLRPIDVLEIPNSRDAFVGSQAEAGQEVVVVFARPHGQPLTEWLSQPRPPSLTLAVLAGLLEFIDQVHQEGVLLYGMGPAVIRIGPAGRVHYTGSDIAVQQPDTDSDSSARSPPWVKLYPAERFPRGFSPPERFGEILTQGPSQNAEAAPDRGGDLYSWGCLVFLLLTDQSPLQLALDQGRCWAHFQDAHFDLLEKALKALPAAEAAVWLEQLGLGGQPAPLTWPETFVKAMRLVLSVDPRRRPRNVAELRRWLAAPPPPMVAGLLALRVAAAEARIFLDAAGLDPAAQIVVRRGLGLAPAGPADGEAVFDGAFRPMIADKRLPVESRIYYAAFTRRLLDVGAVFSAPANAELLDPSRGNLQRLAETAARELLDTDGVPGRIRLCFRAMEPALAAEALLASAQPLVRSWALRVLQQLRRTRALSGAIADRVEAVLWPALHDPVASVRLDAARALLAGGPATDALVHKLAAAMGEATDRQAVQAAQSLRSAGVAEDLIRRVTYRIERERAEPCPLCRKDVAAAQRLKHLISVHAFVELDGMAVPPDKIQARLWGKVFLEANPGAHERLLTLLEGKEGPRSYLAALAQAITETSAGNGESDGTWTLTLNLQRLLQCLRQSTAAPRLIPHLLRLKDRRLREIGREVLLWLLAKQLRAAPCSPEVIRKTLERLCPGSDLLEERILMCLRLAQADLAEREAVQCLAQLQQDRHGVGALEQEQLPGPESRLGKSAQFQRLQVDVADGLAMVCAVCSRPFPRRELAGHLWQEHRLVLDGAAARQPWRVLEDWLVDYRLEKDPALLRRCTDLAHDLEGEKGVFRLQQLMLVQGIDDAQAHAAVLEQATEHYATICPRCFHLTPLPEPIDVSPLTWDYEALEGHGYRLSAAETGLRAKATIATEREAIYSGPEPGRRITRLSAALVSYPPLVLAAFVCLLLVDMEMSWLILLLLALAAGAVLAGFVYLIWPRHKRKRDRLIDAAWSLLVPNLLGGELTVVWGAFLGALATTSRRRATGRTRASTLKRCLDAFATNSNPGLISAHAALIVLQVQDLAAAREDPFPALLNVVANCLQGKQPLALLEMVLAGLTGKGEDDAWIKGRRLRLRALLADALFSAGMELGDLADLAQAYPSLGAIVDVHNADWLVGMHHLCRLKTTKPWARLGQTSTVFDLAAAFAQTEDLVEKYPGLLLAATGKPIYLTMHGLWCKEVRIPKRPGPLVVRRVPGQRGYQLLVGDEHIDFSEPPDELMVELEDWLAYYFDEFQPAINYGVHRGGDGMKALLAQHPCACSHCGVPLLPRPEGIGVAVAIQYSNP